MCDKTYPLKLNRDYTVVTANDLIRGRQKMTLREAQLLFIAISQVVKEDKDFKTYTTTVPELAEFMSVPAQNLYSDLEKICTSLCQRVVKIQVGGNNAKKDKWKVFQWINCAEYDNGTLTIRLSDDIKPFLIDLDRYYSTTLLGTVLSFNSYYATRLYQVLWCEYKAQNESKEDWSFTCDELRELFQVGDKKYKLNRDLIKKTIIPAIEELKRSEFVHIWDYKENKARTKGSPLQGVQFKALFFESRKEKEFFVNNLERMEQMNEERKAEVRAGQQTFDA